VLRTEDALEAVVALRGAARVATRVQEQQRLARAARRLRESLGPSVPKAAAARALGISVTALDRWIDRGLVPVVRSPASRRLRVETAPLIELLEQVTHLRDEGATRPTAVALRRLGRQPLRDGPWIISEELARLPRPNVPTWELAAAAQATTPAERVANVAELSEALTALRLVAQA